VQAAAEPWPGPSGRRAPAASGSARQRARAVGGSGGRRNGLAVWHVPNEHRTLAPHPGGHRGRRAAGSAPVPAGRVRVRSGGAPVRSGPAGPRRL